MTHNLHSSPEASASAEAFPPTSAVAAEAPHDPGFATAAEEDAFWAGVATGAKMVGKSPLAAPGDRDAGDPVRPLAPAESFAESVEIRAAGHGESGRRRRIDGWNPLRMIRFLEMIAATGCVADACKAVGMSVSAAYALRDRREGRAWGAAWEALLIHRARKRLADENLGRAMNGCVEEIRKDGIVVAERRRHDNRLSMAVLSRLDRLAESKDSDEFAMLRAVSEDIEDFYDVIEAGGDADAFIEARRPKPPPRPELPGSVDLDEDFDHVEWVARMIDADPLSDADPDEIPVDDLDPARRERWRAEGWIRAERSHYRLWLDVMAGLDRLPEPDRCAVAFENDRSRFTEAVEEAYEDEDEDEDGFLDRLRKLVCEAFIAVPDTEAGIECEPSTSSTSADEAPPG